MAGTDADDAVRTEFADKVNMTAGQLETWLESDDSTKVGQKSDRGAESTGHAAGRRIVDILRTKKAELSADDVKHMHKVVGYIDRHLAQRPDGDVTDTRWRYSLMNWGHDPLKK